MPNQVTSNSEKIKKQIPTFIDEDDFDFDNFAVKPLNKGLGFHQNKERSQIKMQRAVANVTTSKTISRPSAFDKKANNPAINSPMVSQQELSAFYGTSQASMQTKKEETNNLVEAPYIVATLPERFMAWTIDFLLVAFICSALFSTFLFASEIGFNFDKLTSIFTSLELMVFVVALYSLINLFYFTVLDLGATPGKSLFGLRTLSNDFRSATGVQTFIRSLVSLLSCLAVGLPLLLDFQSHLSDSKVYKKNV